MIKNKLSALTTWSQGHRPTSRLIRIAITIFLIISLFTTVAYAAWDGTGSSSGSSGGGVVTSTYSLDASTVDAVYGYRFSVYDGNGNKLGHSVDINFERYNNVFLYRSYKDSKQSHIDLYKTYAASGTASLGTMSTANTEAAYIYFDSSLPSIPTEVKSWLTDSKAYDIAFLCDAYSFGTATHYIICEPIFIAQLAGANYAMTMAEYAVYQSTQYGWGTPNISGPTLDTYSVIMRQLSAYFGRYLYATGSYPVFGTSAVPESAFKKDANGADSILLGSHTRYNAASDVLKYQMGMAIYTDVIPSYTLTINPNGGKYKGKTEITTTEVLASATITIQNPERPGYTFTGWTTSSSASSISGTTFTQGAEPCTLVAQWEPNKVDIAYILNGGQVTSSDYGDNGNNAVTYNGTPYFHSISYGNRDNPINADSFGLVREGYTFTGWQVLSTGQILDQDTDYDSTVYAKYNDSSKTTANTQNVHCYLVAQWTPIARYTVKYEGNGATAGATPSSSHVYSSLITSSSTEQVGSIEFLRTSHDLAPVIDTHGTGKYVVEFDFKSDVAGQMQAYMQNGSGSKYKMKQSFNATTEWQRYSFIVDVSNSDLSLTNSYLAFYGTYGSGRIPHVRNVVFAKCDETLSENQFSRAGHTFTGWNTKADGTGTTYADKAAVKNLSSTNGATVTLYAQWSPVTYTVTIDPDEGIWDHEGSEYTDLHSLSLEYGSSITISDPYKDGYTFMGWSVSNDSCSLDGTSYTQGEGDCVLTALWAKDSGLTAMSGYFRFIENRYLETLDGNSKWRGSILNELLRNVLSYDFSDTSSCQQVWHFTPEEYEDIREWCLDQEKGTETNKEFLNKFSGYRDPKSEE